MPRLTDRQVWVLHVLEYWREQKVRHTSQLRDAEWNGLDTQSIKNKMIESKKRYEEAERRFKDEMA